MDQKKWWEEAIVYQICLRSFKDTNGDGIGDIQGIIEKLDYVESLGVNTIWINPLTLSAQEDNGYDVIDYKKVDPLFGTDEEGFQLIEEIHKRDMKVIYDFPLNHTSDQHPWFKEALKGKDNQYRDYYIWTDGKESEPYPNNWLAAFGGSAWTKELNGDQYYLHLFKKEMPDTNWDYPPLRDEMAEVLNYWNEKGIDGFHLDAFVYIDVDKDFPKHPDKAVPWTLLNQETVYNVKDQEENEDSILHFYRTLIELKKTPLFQDGSYEMKETEESVYVYERKLEEKRGLVCSNFSDEPATISFNKKRKTDKLFWKMREIQLKTISCNCRHMEQLCLLDK